MIAEAIFGIVRIIYAGVAEGGGSYVFRGCGYIEGTEGFGQQMSLETSWSS